MCKIVLVKNHGITPLPTVGVILRAFTLTPSGKSSVQTGSGLLVGDPGTLPPTSALTAAMLATEPKHGLELRRLKALTPYIPRAWEHYIRPLNLLNRYPSISNGLWHDFSVGLSTYPNLLHHLITLPLLTMPQILRKSYIKSCQRADILAPLISKPLSYSLAQYKLPPFP
jgi:hypothetical protein